MLGIAWLGDAVSSVSSGEDRSCQQWHSLEYRVFLLGLLGRPVALLPEQTPELSCPGGPGPLPALHLRSCSRCSPAASLAAAGGRGLALGGLIEPHRESVSGRWGFRLGFVYHSPRAAGSVLCQCVSILYHLTSARGLGSGAMTRL